HGRLPSLVAARCARNSSAWLAKSLVNLPLARNRFSRDPIKPGLLLLAAEPLPRGLPGDLEGSPNARPGHTALAQDSDQPLEARLGLLADRGDAGKQFQQLLLGHRLLPGRHLRL